MNGCFCDHWNLLSKLNLKHGFTEECLKLFIKGCIFLSEKNKLLFSTLLDLKCYLSKGFLKRELKIRKLMKVWQFLKNMIYEWFVRLQKL